MDTQAYLEVLTREDCLRLLPTVPVGWVAHCHDSRPQLVPVNFVLDQDEVVIRTSYGDKLAAAAHDLVMTFAVSSIDPTSRTGWSVTVTGRARVIEEPAELATPELATLSPWAPGDKDCHIGIPASEITGRRIHRPR